MRRSSILLLVILTPLGLRPSAHAQSLSDSAEAFFETRVRPVLARNCVECHGPLKASGGLRLDSRAAILKGGESGPAVVPGDVEKSLLATAIKHSDDEFVQMPPDDALPAAAVADLKAWIVAGANWPATSSQQIESAKPHWAFSPLKEFTPPPDESKWSEHPIDRFVAAKRAEQDVPPVDAADKRDLLRRACFDLTGLPPTPAQVAKFEEDDRPGAFAELIDELLASPRYGERWGRHWLDLVRYADTAGDNSDYPIPQAYLYRDYVINSFNDDVPYDRFLHEQLAGDILAREAPAEDYSRLVTATGFIAQAMRNGTTELEGMHLIIEDTLAMVGPATLGLTIRCARCHDHKYDPLTQRDYYALYGIFASTQYPFPGAEELKKQTHMAPLLIPDELQRRQAIRAKEIEGLKAQIEELKNTDLGQQIRALARNIADREQEIKEAAPSGAAENSISELTALKSERDSLQKQLDEKLKPIEQELARRERSPLEGIPVAYAVSERTPADAAIQIGGEPHRPGEVVARGAPKCLDAESLEIPPGASGRRELARWMTTRASFLTARVMVNRIWQHHFGKPIVPTPSDFGMRGAPPTHPELLDWLAGEFIASGWSVKHMHRLVMNSRTYQLSTNSNPRNAELDASNAWCWRFDRRRLDAEEIRDAILFLAGTLDLSQPGAHPFPAPSTWKFTAHHQFNQGAYPSNHRSVYLMVQRLHAHPYLSLFNGSDATLSTAGRETSSVSLQALFLLNDKLVHAAADGFARSLIEEESDAGSKTRLAFLRAFSRTPTKAEERRFGEFIEDYKKALEAENLPREQWELAAWSAATRTLLASNEFIFVN